jgi:radical SAM protein with 4Fe4S-binding SPASM domain
VAIKNPSDNENFCILPWMHLYAEPDGNVFPCCTAVPYPGIPELKGSLKDNTLAEIYHSDEWNKLRKDMMEGKRNDACTRCWQFDDAGGSSYRKHNNNLFKKHFNLVDLTAEDGSIEEFHFKAINIRFSTECNFACLTCGPSWSTGWNKYIIGPKGPNLKLEDNTKESVWDQIKEHLPTVDEIYFTGGEPLMMPEHYKILDYLIQQGLTDMTLRYNTNMSNLNFYKYNVVDKWRMFKKVEVGASIDAYGERAELVRLGTKWDQVEANLLSLKGIDNINLGIDSVISILNVDHIPKFHLYLEHKGIVDETSIMSYNIAFSPPEFNIQAIPVDMKEEIKQFLEIHLENYSGRMTHPRWGFPQIISFMKEKDTWDRSKLVHNLHSRFRHVYKEMTENIPIIKQLLRHE